MSESNGLPDNFMLPYVEMKNLVKRLKAVDCRDPAKMNEGFRCLDRIGELFWQYTHEIPEELSGLSESDSMDIGDMFYQKYKALLDAEGRQFDQADCMLKTCRAIAGLMLALMEIWYGQFGPSASGS